MAQFCAVGGCWIAISGASQFHATWFAPAQPWPVPEPPRLRMFNLPPPVLLENYIATGTESCAVLKTATGHWLFVSANMADLYADLLKLSGKGRDALPVYGYVNEGILPLLVFKAPADLPLPSCEEGYFREPIARATAR